MNTEKPIIIHETIVEGHESTFLFLLKVLNLRFHYHRQIIKVFFAEKEIEIDRYYKYDSLKDDLYFFARRRIPVECQVEVWA